MTEPRTRSSVVLGALSRAIRTGSLLLLWLAAAWGFQPPQRGDRVLPDLDVRAFGAEPQPPSDEVRAALDNLRNRLPGDVRAALRARFSRLTGGARLLVLRRGFLSDPSDDSAEQIARRFLDEHAAAFGLTAGDLATLLREREYSGLNESLTHLSFQQTIDDIPVFEADIRFHITSDGRIALISSSAAPVQLPSGRRSRTAAETLRVAAASIRPETPFEPEVTSGPSGPEQTTVFDAGPFLNDITASLVWFPRREGLTQAWRFKIAPTGFPQEYDILVDAFSGEVLFRQNLHRYADASGTVLQSDATQAIDARLPDPEPTGSGALGCPPVANHISRSLNAPFLRPDTVIGDNGRLQGNNAHVFRTSRGDEGAFAPDLRFDFPFNSADAAETNLFFAINFMHDFFYDLGFDGPSGNFQEDNFGQGGAGGDSVHCLARARGRSNATFQTPRDGLSPTMSMFLWGGTGCWAEELSDRGIPDLDGDFDLDIIAHEYHHGVTFRLNTHWSGSEAGAMGEGGGDFYAYSINGDTDLGEYAAPPIGIRQINAKTYGNWSCRTPNSCEVHANGEIWANTL